MFLRKSIIPKQIVMTFPMELTIFVKLLRGLHPLCTIVPLPPLLIELRTIIKMDNLRLGAHNFSELLQLDNRPTERTK